MYTKDSSLLFYLSFFNQVGLVDLGRRLQQQVLRSAFLLQLTRALLVRGHLFFKNFYFIFFDCVGSSLLRAGFLQLWRARATLRCRVRASHCGGFSCCRAQALGAWASVVVARGLSSCGSRALECRLSSCGARAQLLHGTWDLPGPGLKPVSPALAGGFLTTAPQGKPKRTSYIICRSK